MRRVLKILFLSIVLGVSACTFEGSAPTLQPETSLPPLPSSSATLYPTPLPPTPFPDTPSPAEIDAPLIEAPALVEIQFYSELEGWAVTETQIARTKDGGITWYDVTPPDMAATEYSLEIFFLDQDHAWVQKPDFENFPNHGFLFRTSDGGRTWMTSATPFSDGEISFLDEDNGWMLANLGAGAGSNAVAIYQTANGGVHWELKYINDPNHPDAKDSLPLGGLKTGITARNMQTVWVGGVTYAPGTLYLYRSNDGGSNWSQIILELPPSAENSELSIDTDQMQFVTANDGFLAVHMAGDSTQTAIYVTRDAGDTWTLTPTLIPNDGSFDFLSAQEAVIYNGEQFYVTRDAARTWSIILPDIIFGESFATIDFVNVSSGWVITIDLANHHSLYRTTDGGAMWSPILP
jgi:photosystem II stability/assembly factor-like uncharacterized protein